MDEQQKRMLLLKAQIYQDIQKAGFSIMSVVGDVQKHEPTFSYTTGLYPKMPELVITGMNPNDAVRLFHLIVDKREAGTVIEAGRTYSTITPGFTFAFAPVLPEHCHKFATGATIWHGGTDYILLQCIWPDTHNRLPWEPGFEQRFIEQQPLLYMPNFQPGDHS